MPTQKPQILKFQVGNAKLNREIATFSLPSGHTCPFAVDCLAKADRVTGRITDGPQAEFRCSSASDESRSPHARRARWHNFNLLRRLDTVEMTNLLELSLPANDITRVHVGGDYFNQKYFDAWRNVAANHSGRMFYGYTKSLPYWVARLADMPPNLNLTASVGSRHDELISRHGLRFARVVLHPRQAATLGLEIDHDDSHAMIHGRDPFALLIHGTQPAGSDAAAALKAMRDEGVQFAYSRHS